MSINKVTLIGRLGADPETKTFQNGDKVANIRIATSERWKDKNTGERQERTEWHSVAVFGPLADVVDRYTKKGDQIYLEGKLRTRKWQDQSGNDRYTTEVLLQGPTANLTLLGGNGGGNGNGNGGSDQGDQRQNSGGGSQQRWDESNNGPGRNANGQSSSRFAADLDDDIPF